MPGRQSRGLIQASKTMGWDPTKIPARAGRPEVDLAKIDVDPCDSGNVTTSTPVYGMLPGGLPGGWPNGTQPAGGPIDPPHVGTVDIFGKPLFATPDLSRETVSRGVGTELPVNGMSGTATPPPPQPATPNSNSGPVSQPDYSFTIPNHSKAGVGRTTNADPFAGFGGQ